MASEGASIPHDCLCLMLLMSGSPSAPPSPKKHDQWALASGVSKDRAWADRQSAVLGLSQLAQQPPSDLMVHGCACTEWHRVSKYRKTLSPWACSVCHRQRAEPAKYFALSLKAPKAPALQLLVDAVLI